MLLMKFKLIHMLFMLIATISCIFHSCVKYFKHFCPTFLTTLKFHCFTNSTHTNFSKACEFYTDALKYCDWNFVLSYICNILELEVLAQVLLHLWCNRLGLISSRASSSFSLSLCWKTCQDLVGRYSILPALCRGSFRWYTKCKQSNNKCPFRAFFASFANANAIDRLIENRSMDPSIDPSRGRSLIPKKGKNESEKFQETVVATEWNETEIRFLYFRTNDF